MMIHDAMWVEAPEEEADEVRHLVEENDDHGGKAGCAVESGFLLI